MRSVTYSPRGYTATEHVLSVPLDHRRPDGEQIELFAREIAAPDGGQRPFLVYLQGGPGHEATRPGADPLGPSWLTRALSDYRVLLLDQRGTGRSSPIGTLPGMSPAQQAEYLTHFRSDAIVADAELLRDALGVRQWSILGQSFGGFVALRYLSAAPDSLRMALFTGGLPAIDTPLEDIYRATYQRMAQRNRRYYQRYEADADVVRALATKLDDSQVLLPDGDRLTSRRLRQLGPRLGMSGGSERLHHLLERQVSDPAFRYDAVELSPFSGRNPLYAILHEACWADGTATNWAAQRTLPESFEQHPEWFFGEHVFDWMLTEYRAFTPLAQAAQLLAEHEWPKLYDPAVLARNDVACAAAVYAEDAYVECELSLRTAHSVRGLRPWITNEFDHNGIGVDGARILDRLIAMAHDRV